jgi:hypothetical protein
MKPKPYLEVKRRVDASAALSNDRNCAGDKTKAGSRRRIDHMKNTTPIHDSKTVAMDKKATDRAINRWALKCLFGPASLLCLLSFVIGYWYPDTMHVVQPIAQQLGLHSLVAPRTMGAEFDSAAYFYWLTFWVVLPFNLVWIYREGIRQNMPMALRAVARANLTSGAWDRKKFTIKGGRIRFFFFALFFVSIFIVQLVTAREPSYCKGCETTSAIGFLVFNWLGAQMALIAIYFTCSYFVLWKSIRTTFGKNDE